MKNRSTKNERFNRIEQSTSSYECIVRCSDIVKSFKVTFKNGRVDTLEVELKEEKEN